MNKINLSLAAGIAIALQFMSITACNSQSQATDVTAVADSTVDYKTAFLVDVRTPEEFAEGSARGAVNIPVDDIETRIKEFDGKGNIVVFCRSGKRSSRAKSILEEHGIKSVTNGGTWEAVAAVVGSTK
jgi:phage shock protein E